MGIVRCSGRSVNEGFYYRRAERLEYLDIWAWFHLELSKTVDRYLISYFFHDFERTYPVAVQTAIGKLGSVTVC